MKTNTYSIFAADTMESAALPLFTAASDTIWSRDVPLGGSLLVQTLDEIVLDLNRQIPGVKNILPDILEIALDNLGDYNLSALKAVLEFDRRTSNPVNVTSAGENLLHINLQGAGISEKDRTLTGNRRIRIQLKNGNMVCRNLKVCCDAKIRPLAHLRGRLLSAPAPATEYCCQSDNNKNITSLTNDVGAICAAWEYDAYGNIVNQTGEKLDVNPLRFSSEYHDEELGLVYYNYRHYNPKEGRWISRDPIAEKGGINIYSFNYNNAIIQFDLLGFETQQAHPDSFGGGWKVGNELSVSPVERRKDTFYTESDLFTSPFNWMFVKGPLSLQNRYNRFVSSLSVTQTINKFMAELEPDALEWFTHYIMGTGLTKKISPVKMIKKNAFFKRKITAVAKSGLAFAVSNKQIGVFIRKDWDNDNSSQQTSIGEGDGAESNTDYWSIPYILGGFSYAAVGCVSRRNKKHKISFDLYIDDWYWFHDSSAFMRLLKIQGAREFRTKGKSFCSYSESKGLECIDYE